MFISEEIAKDDEVSKKQLMHNFVVTDREEPNWKQLVESKKSIYKIPATSSTCERDPLDDVVGYQHSPEYVDKCKCCVVVRCALNFVAVAFT